MAFAKICLNHDVKDSGQISCFLRNPPQIPNILALISSDHLKEGSTIYSILPHLGRSNTSASFSFNQVDVSDQPKILVGKPNTSPPVDYLASPP